MICFCIAKSITCHVLPTLLAWITLHEWASRTTISKWETLLKLSPLRTRPFWKYMGIMPYDTSKVIFDCTIVSLPRCNEFGWPPCIIAAWARPAHESKSKEAWNHRADYATDFYNWIDRVRTWISTVITYLYSLCMHTTQYISKVNVDSAFLSLYSPICIVHGALDCIIHLALV